MVDHHTSSKNIKGNNYLNDIIENGKLTDEDIEETKQEQSEIIKSIDAIKGDLDKIILE